MARSSNKPVDAMAALTEMVANLAAQVAALTPASPAPVAKAKPASAKRAPAKAKPAKGAKVYTWKPWACSKFAIPTTVGMSFAYCGKSGSSDHIVTAYDSATGIVSSVRA